MNVQALLADRDFGETKPSGVINNLKSTKSSSARLENYWGEKHV